MNSLTPHAVPSILAACRRLAVLPALLALPLWAAEPRAALSLSSSGARLAQTGTTAWSLEKTGLVDAINQTVQWTVLATEGQTQAGQLGVVGTISLRNSGPGAATLGNIVVNLQTRVGKQWQTQSSNVADASLDDAATEARVVAGASSEKRSVFSENSASGPLLFMDAHRNSVFSLVPAKTIAPGTTLTLRFQARFDNTVLALPVGTPVRAEVLVSFGNAVPSASPNSGQNLDIDGSGGLEPDEDYVRSLPTRLSLTVPKQTPATAVTLSDTVEDLTTTGTVSFSNPVFNLSSPAGGSVSVDYDPGTDGGNITNCAHLTAPGTALSSGGSPFTLVEPLDLQACDTQVIGPQVCTPGTTGCGWMEGEVVTHTPLTWGDENHTAGQLLTVRFDEVYASTGLVEIGIIGSNGFSMVFTRASAVLAYLPAAGTVAALNGDLVDPTVTLSGVFGGEVLALELNVDFADAGRLAGTSEHVLGDLTMCRFAAFPGLNGTSIRAFLDLANVALGGGATPYSISTLNTVAGQLNAAFNGGLPSTFAQNHLFNGACPP